MKIADINVEYINHCGDDLSVVNAARVSFHKESEWDEVAAGSMEEAERLESEGYEDVTDLEHDYQFYFQKLSEADGKLINYLAKHKHFSPFNHAFLSFRVKAPIFVARQLVKHKFMPWNEVSRRYVDDEPEFFIPELRKRADNVKQGSASEIVFPDYDPISSVKKSLEMYNWLLSDGVAPEVARAFLPQNMMTEWLWSGTLGAFADMLRLRLDPHTQVESQIVAEKIYKEVERRFPVSIKALLND